MVQAVPFVLDGPGTPPRATALDANGERAQGGAARALPVAATGKKVLHRVVAHDERGGAKAQGTARNGTGPDP